METDAVPVPIVLIDQDSDPDATIVQVSFGDRLGALIDTVKLSIHTLCKSHRHLEVFNIHHRLRLTCNLSVVVQMKALKDLGLDVAKGTVSTEASLKQTKIFITHM